MVKQKKIVDVKKFLKMKLRTRKSWSWRSIRWLEKMPQRLQDLDPTKKGTKNELKKWVQDRIPVRGCRIMWGKQIEREGENRQHRAETQEDREGDEDQGREEEQGGEQEQEGENDSEQFNIPRDVEGEDDTMINMQGLANTIRRHQAKNKNMTYFEQAVRHISKTEGQESPRKTVKKTNSKSIQGQHNSQKVRRCGQLPGPPGSPASWELWVDVGGRDRAGVPGSHLGPLQRIGLSTTKLSDKYIVIFKI